MGSARELGTLGTRAAGFAPWDGADAAVTARLAEVLAEENDSILAAYVDGEAGFRTVARRGARGATRRVLVHPVFFGSALTGAGVDSLMSGIAELLPAADQDSGSAGTASGR